MAIAQQHKDFCNQYTRARDIQADVLFDEIHQIADTPQKGTKTARRGEGIIRLSKRPKGMLGDLVDPAHYPSLAAFCARAEELPAFRAAPPIDGVTAPAD